MTKALRGKYYFVAEHPTGVQSKVGSTPLTITLNSFSE